MTMFDCDAFAEEWIGAFNARDLERILSHYSVGIELISPLYLRFSNGQSDTVRGIGELRTYFGSALQRYPELRFTLLEVGKGSRGPCIRYHTTLGDRIAMEAFEVNTDGKAERVLCHYVGN